MPKKGTIIQPVKILDLVPGGEARGLWEAEGQETLSIRFDARGVMPGDVVAARLLGKRNGLWHGKLDRILTGSPSRLFPRCSHFGICGGCGLQHWPYALQLLQKEALVKGCLSTFDDRTEWLPAIGCKEQWFFRNKMEYTASARPWQELPPDAETLAPPAPAFGLFVPFSGNKVLDIRNCLLQDPLGNEIRNWWRSYAQSRGYPVYHSSRHDGWLRTLLVRTARTGESLVMFIVASERPETGPEDALQSLVADFIAGFPQVTSVWTLVNPKLNDSYADLKPVHAAGKIEIREELGKYRFGIGPQTFFQVNSHQTRLLYERILEFADLGPKDVAYDLYCGVGSISLFLASQAKKVIGIEYVESSIQSARQNALDNGLGNLEFFAGDMKDLLVPGIFETHGAPDVVVTDPPRAGMHAKACETMAASGARRIVYVSCNSESLARDLRILTPRYRLAKVQAIDLMPHSHHVESIALLEKQ
jgi:23S rRNA (uracil1939-C5)-methyltransferase